MNTIRHYIKKIASKSWMLVMLAVLLSACQRGMDVSDEELIKRMNECHKPGTKTPAMAVMCGNYKDECMRRGKKTGNYFCG